MKDFVKILFASTIFILLLPACDLLQDNQPPSVEILSPANGAEFDAGDKIKISAEANDPDGTIDEVRFYIDDIGISSASSFPYNYDWNSAGEAEGVHSIKVTALDNDGASVSDDIVIILNTSEPDPTADGTFMDMRDSTVYKTVKIGSQTWMAENLAYLPQVDLVTDESSTLPKYYVYGYNGNGTEKVKTTENYKTYGVLYNWPAAEDACPDGWHLPLDEEWEVLAAYISQDNGGYVKDNDDWESLGIHLKATSGWDSGGDGTDDYEFSALPGGERSTDGTFSRMTYGGNWWSAAEAGGTDAFTRALNSDIDDFMRYYFLKEAGFSVRCIKD